MPAAIVFFLVAPHPIVAGLFQWGAFGAGDSAATAGTLAAYAAGLPAFVLIKALLPGLYARYDTALRRCASRWSPSWSISRSS